MSALRGAVLGVVTGAAAFVALQHADRLRAVIPADAAVEQIAGAVRSVLPEVVGKPPEAMPSGAGEVAASAPEPPMAIPPATGGRIDPEALQGLAIEAPAAREEAPSLRNADRAAGIRAAASQQSLDETTANGTPDATPSLAEARRRAVDVAAAVERLGRRLERGGGR